MTATSKKEEDPEPVLKLESYEKQRYQNFEFQLNQAGFFDKGLLTLSSSALGVLFATKHQIAATYSAHPSAYFLAVVCFTVSLVLTLGSFQTSIKACKLEIDRLDETFRTQIYVEQTLSDKAWDTTTTALNILSMASFVAGVVTMIFIFLC